ncbi:MAG: Mrp/NBP35 family ATP-binding protein, partial [Candidatus Latescibacteria bacterium]|nr:Mrp/NBP35 family ATP-binding protein [Candidatus Latescibacterota bacterium]
TPACPVREKLQEEARASVAAISGVEAVEVRMTASVRPMLGGKKEEFIPGVKNVIPVASGKGGVGKSTVSANLALALAKTGASVGLMDADVYGPSIPTIMGVRVEDGPQVLDNGNGSRIIPAERYGIKIISMGFFMKQEEAVIWRGPMLHKMIHEFLGSVEWGELDYLVVDLPPGTGDVQLSLCQTVPLTGAAIVSTPQDVALFVAQKAIAMFHKLNCPILGLIENMSYYICRHCGAREEIFGSGGVRRACERLDIPFLGEIPLATDIRTTSDAGRPIVIEDPESPLSQAFCTVAGHLAAQISIRNLTMYDLPLLAV